MSKKGRPIVTETELQRQKKSHKHRFELKISPELELRYSKLIEPKISSSKFYFKVRKIDELQIVT